MLGRTAGGLFWMSRYLERAENIARMVEAGFRIAITRSTAPEDEWTSILTTAAARESYAAIHEKVDAAKVIDFLLRGASNPSSVRCAMESARTNARLVRTALTREVWEAINVCWMSLRDALAAPVDQSSLPELLRLIRQQSAFVRGAIHGTMLRNDIYNFMRIGAFTERAESTARILDVKYYILLPQVAQVGSSVDNIQWETILRSTSADRAFGWLHGGESSPSQIAEFLILDRRMPRSVQFCCVKMVENFTQLENAYGFRPPSVDMAHALLERLSSLTIQAIFAEGLHEFIHGFLAANFEIGQQIEKDYRFYR